MVSKRMALRGLPLLCACTVSFVFISQSVIYFRQEPQSNELVRLFQGLQVAQMESRETAVLTLNSSLRLEKAENATRAESSEDKERKTTRGWFDRRPGVNSSKVPVDGHPFFPGYIIENPHVCKDERVDLLIYFHSGVDHNTTRRYLREGWASTQTFTDISVKVVFILGMPESTMAQRHIETEYSTYGDIVQGRFADTFRNLTYKAMTMLTWVNSHCSHARYILKADDDIFVDIFRVITELVSKLAPKKLAVACDYKENLPILRDARTKWFVNETVLKGEKLWPPFCPGYFTVITGDAIPQLYEASFDIKEFIPVEDAYLYGILVRARNITLEYVNIHTHISPNERPDPDREININGRFEYLAFGTKKNEDHWKLFEYRSNKLSSWDQSHSQFYEKFVRPNRKGVVII